MREAFIAMASKSWTQKTEEEEDKLGEGEKKRMGMKVERGTSGEE